MTKVAATEFKARCLELMDRVAERRETYVITKRGRPVAKLVPADPPAGRSILGCLAGQFESEGDIVSSPRTDEQWAELARAREAAFPASRPRRRGGRTKGRAEP